MHPVSLRCLEALLLDLLLGRGDGLGRGGVLEAAALLAVLVAGGGGGADAHARGVDLGAAGAAAVGVGDAAARRELSGLAVADVLGSGVVGGQGKGGDGDCAALALCLGLVALSGCEGSFDHLRRHPGEGGLTSQSSEDGDADHFELEDGRKVSCRKRLW